MNGAVGGSCGVGLCQMGGGTAAGSNLFHRFLSFAPDFLEGRVRLQRLGTPL